MTSTTTTAAVQAYTMGNGDWLRLLFLSLLWGGTFFFAEVAVETIPPLTLAWARVGLAALVLVLVMAVLGQLRNLGAWPWGSLLAMGLLNNAIPFSLIFWGQSGIESGLASILNATAPFWSVALGAWVIRSEPITAKRACGLLLGLAGVVLLIGPDALSGLGEGVWFQLAVLAAALSYALAGIWGRRLRTLSPWQAASGQLICSTLLLAPIALFIDRPWTLPLPDSAALASVLGLALLSTALAYLLFFRILRDAGPTNLLLVTLLIPPSAILLGSLFLGERFGLFEVGGLILILSGLAAIDGRAIRYLSRCFNN